MLLAVVLGLSALWSCTAQAPLALYKLTSAQAAEFGAACLDGTPPGLYALVQDPTKWILFLEGGGWCFDTTAAGTIANCAGRAQGGGGSSNNMGATMNVGGLLSSDSAVNPHFFNYSLVFLHYCDGTSFSGNATLPVTVPGDAASTNGSAPQTIFFRGRANLKAMWWFLESQLGMSSATDIILSGGSAGATAAYLALDTVASWVPPSTRVVGAPDAGFFLDAFQVSSNTTWYRDCFIAADPVWNATGSGGVNADCLAAFPNATWRCFLQQYAAPFIQTPLMILNSAYDQWQILNDLGLGCVPSTTGRPVAGVPSCDATKMAVFQQYRLAQLAAVAPVLTGYPHNGAFIDSCFVHEQNVDYCSGQSLPNCVGWNIFTVQWNGTAISMDTAFSLWYTSLTHMWPEVVRARAEYRESVVLPRLLAAGDAPSAVSSPAAPLPTTVVAPEQGSVQVIDASVYPANPSCPFPTPTPPPGPRVTLASGGACLWFNASAYPCFGGDACTLTMGPCGSPGSYWYLGKQAGPLASADVDGVVINIDCDRFTTAHTVAWALSSGAASFVFDAAAKTLTIASPGGLCLNAGEGPATPACNPSDPWLPQQVQLAACSDPSATAWVATPT